MRRRSCAGGSFCFRLAARFLLLHAARTCVLSVLFAVQHVVWLGVRAAQSPAMLLLHPVLLLPAPSIC